MALLWPKKEKILGQLESAPPKDDLNGNVCGHCGEARGGGTAIYGLYGYVPL